MEANSPNELDHNVPGKNAVDADTGHDSHKPNTVSVKEDAKPLDDKRF